MANHCEATGSVFISYAWGGESERVVNLLDAELQERGLTIIRDKRDLGFKGNIKEFMQRIGKGQCVIVVLSDKYLKSKNCMFELLEIASNDHFYDRIFPIVLADASIYDAVVLLNYVKYWDEKIAELNVAVKTVEVIANIQAILADINLYTRIRAGIIDLTGTISNMNTLTSEIHQNTNFTALFEAIQTKLETDNRTTGDPNISPVSTEHTINNFKESSMSDGQKSLHIGSIGNISDIKGPFAFGGDAVGGNKIVGNIGGDYVAGNKTSGDIVSGNKIGGHQVGGNFVGGDNITTTTTNAGTAVGFKTEQAQQQFMSELDQLRKLIVEARSQIELNASEHADAEKLMQELSEVVKSLQAAKTQASKLTVGQAAPPEQAKTFDDCLKTAENLVNKAQQFGEKVAELSLKLAPVALPLLNGVRALLKL